MFDLHCHILPGLDDGAASPEIAIEMAAAAARSGVTHIFATPHSNTRNEQKNLRSMELIDAFKDLQRALERLQIPVRILSGAEILARGRFREHLEAGDFMTLNGSRYLLVEFYFDETPDYMEYALQVVEGQGLVPVIAHPERYYCIQEMPALAERWAHRGRPLQLNKGSLLGELGEGAYLTSNRLLRRNVISVIASDAHHYRYRDPHMGALLEALEFRFPQADPMLLLRDNPKRIAKNLPLETL